MVLRKCAQRSMPDLELHLYEPSSRVSSSRPEAEGAGEPDTLQRVPNSAHRSMDTPSPPSPYRVLKLSSRVRNL